MPRSRSHAGGPTSPTRPRRASPRLAPVRRVPYIVEKWRPLPEKAMCAIALLLIIGMIVGGFMLGRAERSWARN